MLPSSAQRPRPLPLSAAEPLSLSAVLGEAVIAIPPESDSGRGRVLIRIGRQRFRMRQLLARSHECITTFIMHDAHRSSPGRRRFIIEEVAERSWRRSARHAPGTMRCTLSCRLVRRSHGTILEAFGSTGPPLEDGPHRSGRFRQIAITYTVDRGEAQRPPWLGGRFFSVELATGRGWFEDGEFRICDQLQPLRSG